MWEEDEDAVSLSLSLSSPSLSSLSLSSLSLSVSRARSLTPSHPPSPSLPSSALRNRSSIPDSFALFVRQVIDIIMKHNDQKDDTAAVKALCVQKFDLCKSSDIAVSKAHEEL